MRFPDIFSSPVAFNRTFTDSVRCECVRRGYRQCQGPFAAASFERAALLALLQPFTGGTSDWQRISKVA
jgi:hypothetical protein